MRKNCTSRCKAIIAEMIIVMIFFSLCAGHFAAAKVRAGSNKDLNMATELCQKAAEAYKDCQGDIEMTAEMLNAEYYMGQAKLYYDDDWNETGKIYARFEILIEDEGREGCVNSCRIYAQEADGYNKGRCIFSIGAKAYRE